MNLNLIIAIVVGIILVVGAICYFLNEKKSVKEWLFLGVVEVEKALGSKTGKLKLRQVFKEFVTLFPVFSKFITFDTFSKWVDGALDQMKESLKSNTTLQKYIGVSEEEVSEKGDTNG